MARWRTRREPNQGAALDSLGRAAFVAAIYAAIFLGGDIIRLVVPPENPSGILPMGATLPDLVVSVALPSGLVVVGVLLVIGYRRLFWGTMANLADEAQALLWTARRWFRGMVGLLVSWIFGFMALVAVSVLPAPNLAKLGTFAVWTLIPYAVVMAYILFLSYTVLRLLTAPWRRLLQRIVWSDLVVTAATAAESIYLVSQDWGNIQAKEVYAVPYSVWSGLPFDAVSLLTLAVLFLAYRQARAVLQTATPPPAVPT